MVEQNIVLNIRPPLGNFVFFAREIPARIIRDTAGMEREGQVPEKEAFQIYTRNMQNALGPLQHRRRENFPDRNIHIRDAVLENCLLRGIGKLIEVYGKVCFVGTGAFKMQPVSKIQRVDQCLLDALILVIVQCIEFHDRVKNLMICLRLVRNRDIRRVNTGLTDFRKRERNNRKASVAADNRLVIFSGRSLTETRGHFVLRRRKLRLPASRARRKRFFTESFHDCGAGVNLESFRLLSVRGTHCLDSSVCQKLIQNKSQIILMIKRTLTVRCRPRVSALRLNTEKALQGSWYDAFFSHCLKI